MSKETNQIKSNEQELLRLNSNAFLYPIKYAIVLPCKSIKELDELESKLRSKEDIYFV